VPFFVGKWGEFDESRSHDASRHRQGVRSSVFAVVRAWSTLGEREIDRAFYVQVRYPHGERWETVAVSAHRGVAASLAGGMYRDLRDDAGRSPVQVRIASDEKLRRAGGESAVRQAAADLWERAQATARGDP
jgi:hypothetical protein